MKRIFITEKQKKILLENISSSYFFDDEISVLSSLISSKREKKIFLKRKNELYNIVKNFFHIETDLENPILIKNHLSKLLNEICKKEKTIKYELEKMCLDTINEILFIPDGLIKITCELVKKIDSSNTIIHIDTIDDEPEFSDVNEIIKNENEIQKRLVLNLLIDGAANCLTKFILKIYKKNIYKLDDSLYNLYKKFLYLNEYYLTLENVKITDDTPNQAGGVVVNIGNNNKQTVIKSVSLCFPILIFETLKGLFELFISHGLPSDKTISKYIIEQSDSLKYSQYNSVMGSAIWSKIMDKLSENNVNTNIMPYFMTNLSQYPLHTFNYLIKEIILNTKNGKNIIEKIINGIQNEIDYEDFENRLSVKRNEKNIIYDNEYMSENELLDEKFFSMDDVINTNTPIPNGMVNSIPNELGINLSSVNGFSIEKQPDNQIKKITIDFIPEN